MIKYIAGLVAGVIIGVAGGVVGASSAAPLPWWQTVKCGSGHLVNCHYGGPSLGGNYGYGYNYFIRKIPHRNLVCRFYVLHSAYDACYPVGDRYAVAGP